MAGKSAHEPQAKLMSVADVWDDAQQIASMLRQAEPMVRLQIPLSLFLAALDSLDHDDLMILHRRVEERLATC